MPKFLSQISREALEIEGYSLSAGKAIVSCIKGACVFTATCQWLDQFMEGRNNGPFKVVIDQVNDRTYEEDPPIHP